MVLYNLRVWVIKVRLSDAIFDQLVVSSRNVSIRAFAYHLSNRIEPRMVCCPHGQACVFTCTGMMSTWAHNGLGAF